MSSRLTGVSGVRHCVGILPDVWAAVRAEVKNARSWPSSSGRVPGLSSRTLPVRPPVQGRHPARSGSSRLLVGRRDLMIGRGMSSAVSPATQDARPPPRDALVQRGNGMPDRDAEHAHERAADQNRARQPCGPAMSAKGWGRPYEPKSSSTSKPSPRTTKADHPPTGTSSDGTQPGS